MSIHYFKLQFKNDNQGNPCFASFPFVKNGVPLKDFICGISSRFTGDMKYDKKNSNRLALFRNLNLHSEKVYGLNQIHSQTVLAVDINNPPTLEADGMVTKTNELCLSVTIADCLPLFLLDSKNGAFGIVHSGWKGTGIANNALDLIVSRFGSSKQDVAVVLGPCIGVCCYKVDSERAFTFEKNFGTECVMRKDDNFYIDLKKANIKLLTDAGICHIAVCEDCTCCDSRLGSFRREGEGFTRMIALVIGANFLHN